MALVGTNEYNTPVTQELLDLYDEEIQEQFLCFINEVPYIKNLISPNRRRVSDLPKDEQGRVIVDLENPHILEDMDYFRPAAIHFEKYGCYTKLRPNGNPKSEYGKWIREEYRRCFEGYVRKSDGEWIPGDYYFFLNYCPILLTEDNGTNAKSGRRKIGFPRVWDGHYLMFHYLNRARGNGKHGFILASRSKGKSLSVASMLGKRFVLGEFMDVMKRVTSYITAADKSKLIGGDQTLNKFQAIIDHLAQNTEFPRKRLLSSLNDMTWTMGYKDLDTGTQKGSLNTVVGVSSADNASKLRGTRGVLYVLEEAGTFSNLKKLYANLRPSVEEGQRAFGQIVGIGTAGDQESDFAGMQEIMYHPIGYRVQEVKNVYDRLGYGKEYFSYFFPGYMNYDGCYDENGNSDVVKALLIILQDRFQVKYNTSDVNAITKRIAEIPIVPQEAILRYGSNMFPITQINERIAQIDNNPAFYDDVYVGDLVLTKSGNVEFQISDKQPIRDFPLSMEENQRTEGALEIYEMPVKINGKIPEGRYIIGLDNYENDAAKSMSLGSMFVLDLFTDRIVAEYTGRPAFADDLNEKCRLLCLFYNARCLYESNKKNTYAYFSRMNSLSLLADTPDYLRQRQLIKYSNWGNSSKGVQATMSVKAFGLGLIRDWLLKPVVTEVTNDEGVTVQITLPNLYYIKSRALLRELASFNPDLNVDRIMALLQVMLYREEKMILYQGDMGKLNEEVDDKDYLGNDEFFTTNYDKRFSAKITMKILQQN